MKAGEAFALLLLADVKEELEHDIPAVPQLPLELVDGTNGGTVLIAGDVAVQVFADCAFHPAGIIEHDLSVFGNRRRILIQEGITLLRLGQNHRRDDVIKARVDLADQIVDKAALSGRCPAFDQHDDRELCFADQLLLGDEALAKCAGFRLQGFGCLVLCLRLFGRRRFRRLRGVRLHHFSRIPLFRRYSLGLWLQFLFFGLFYLGFLVRFCFFSRVFGFLFALHRFQSFPQAFYGEVCFILIPGFV